jgi:N-acetylglutamate synthase
MSTPLVEEQVSDVSIKEMSITDYDAVYGLLRATPGIRLRSADSREAVERYLARNLGMSFVARSGRPPG